MFALRQASSLRVNLYDSAFKVRLYAEVLQSRLCGEADARKVGGYTALRLKQAAAFGRRSVAQGEVRTAGLCIEGSYCDRDGLSWIVGAVLRLPHLLRLDTYAPKWTTLTLEPFRQNPRLSASERVQVLDDLETGILAVVIWLSAIPSARRHLVSEHRRREI